MAYQSIHGSEKADNSGGYRSLFDTDESYEVKRKKRRDEVAVKMVEEEQVKKKQEEQARQERETQAKEKITPKEYSSVWEQIGDKFEANSQQDKAKRVRRGDVESYQDQQAIQDGYKKRDYTDQDRKEAFGIKQDLDKRLKAKEIDSQQYVKEFEERGMNDRPNYTTTPTVEDVDTYKKQRAGEVRSLVKQREAEGKPLKAGQVAAMFDEISSVDEQYKSARDLFERDKPRSAIQQVLGAAGGSFEKFFLSQYGNAMTVAGAGVDLVDGNAADGVARTLKKGGKNWNKTLDEMIDASVFSQNSIAGESQFLVNTGSAVGSLGSSVATAGMGSTGTAAKLFGVQAGTETYQEMQDKGKSNLQSILTAVPSGVAEAGLEKIGLDRFLGIDGSVGLKRAMKGFAVEGAQEMTQSAAQSTISATYRDGAKNKDYWLAASVNAAKEGLYGGMAGGVGTIAIATSESLQKAGTPKDIADRMGEKYSQMLQREGSSKREGEITDEEVLAGEDMVSQNPTATPVENPIGLPEASIGDAIDGTIGPVEGDMDSVADIAPPPSGPSDIPGTNIDVTAEQEVEAQPVDTEPGFGDFKSADQEQAKTEYEQTVGERPQAELQKQIEEAHNSGDKQLETELETQLKDKGLNPQENKADLSIVYPESDKLPADLKEQMPVSKESEFTEPKTMSKLTNNEANVVSGADISFTKTDVKTLVKNAPGLSKNPILTVKIKDGMTSFAYDTKEGSASAKGEISAEKMGLSQERLAKMGVKDGQTIDLKEALRAKGKVPVIRNNETGVEGMAIDRNSGQGSIKFDRSLKVKEDQPRDTRGKYSNKKLTISQDGEVDLKELSRLAKNSFENTKEAPKPGGVQRAMAEIDNGQAPPVRIRYLENGELTIEDGRHRVAGGLKAGAVTFPVQDVTSSYNVEAMATESTTSEVEAFKHRVQLTRRQVARDTLEEQTLSVKDAEKLESVNSAIEFLSEHFGTPIRRGRMRMNKALGEHHSNTDVIRIQKTIGDKIVEGGRLGVAVHEIGHSLAKNIPEFKITRGSGIAILGKEGNADLSSISTKPNGAAMSGVYGEGFAEFIRYYVINPQALQQKMPATYKTINETLRDKYPHQYRGLMRVRTMWDVDQKMSAVKKISSLISYSEKKPSMAERVKDGLEKTYKHWVDDLYPIEKLEKMVEKTGIKIELKDKASTLMMLHRGAAGKGKAFLEWGTFGFNPYSKNAKDGKYELEKKGKSFKEITQAIYHNGQEVVFDDYLAAKRALALWQDRKIIQPISPELAKEGIAILEKKYPHFIEAQKELVKYQDSVIDYITEAGMISEENVQSMRQMNRDYVPLFKVMENAARSGQMGKGYANLQSGLKKMKGSELQIISPLESIVKNTYTLIQAADANSAMQALANMASVSPEIAGQIFEEVKTPMTKAASVKLSDLGIVSAEKTIGEGLVTDFDVDQTINLFRPLFRDDSGQTVSVMIKGKPKFFHVSDPSIYKAITQMSTSDANIVTKILTTPASLLRAGATLTPDFVFRNPVRDQFAAFVYSKTGYIPIVDSARGLASVAAKDNDYWMWQISGGAYATLVSVDRSYIRDETRKMLHAKPLRAKLNVVNGLREVSEIMEETTRVGEYKKAIKDRKSLFVQQQAMHPLEAAMASKEITLNFSRRGDYGKQANSIVAFFNAGVQDIDKMVRELRTHPVRTTVKATLTITLPAILLFLANRDEEWYKEIPTWQKDQFFIFKVNNQIVRIPKPFLLGTIFATLPERALGELLNDDSRGMKGVNGYLSGVLPDWIPTGFKPVVEVVTNYDMFGNRQIVPRSEEFFDKSEQYGSYTSETSKILNKLTGNKLSPRGWDHLIKGYTAGLGQYAVQTADMLMSRAGIVDRPDKPKGSTRNIPVIKGFTIDEPRGGSSQSVANFYEASRNATKAETTYKKMIDEGRTKEAMEYKKSHPGMDLAGQYRTIQKSLSELKSAAEKARTSKTLSPQEKSDIITESERQMTYIAKSALQFDPSYSKNAKTSRQPKSSEYNDKISEAAYNGDYQKARDLAEENNRKIDEYVKDLGKISEGEREAWEEKKIKVTPASLDRRRKYKEGKRDK